MAATKILTLMLVSAGCMTVCTVSAGVQRSGDHISLVESANDGEAIPSLENVRSDHGGTHQGHPIRNRRGVSDSASILSYLGGLFSGGGGTLEDILEILKEVQLDIRRLHQKVDILVAGHMKKEISDILNTFINPIGYLHEKMTWNLDLLLTNKSLSGDRLTEKNDIINDLLEVAPAMFNLHQSIMGEMDGIGGQSIIQLYWDLAMLDVDLDYFRVDTELSQKKDVFVEFLLELQEAGYQVWMTARLAKYGSGGYIKNLIEYRKVQQNTTIAGLFIPCSPPLNLTTYPNRQDSLKCSNTNEFGSICEQQCAGDGAAQIKNNSLLYPGVGYPPVQCLINGEWSKNHNAETELGCRLDFQYAAKKKLISNEYAYYRYSGNDKFEFDVKLLGRTKRDSDCKAGCTYLDYNSWAHGFKCQTKNGNNNWDYCRVTREPGRTVYGRVCKSECGGKAYSGSGYKYWCHKSSGWDYCIPPVIISDPENNHFYKTIDGKACCETKDYPPGWTRGYLWCYYDCKTWDWDYCS